MLAGLPTASKPDYDCLRGHSDKNLSPEQRNLAAVSSADFRGELRSLNRELVLQFVDVLGALVERPQASTRGVENIGTLLRNMHYLLNLLRAHQACGPSAAKPMCTCLLAAGLHLAWASSSSLEAFLLHSQLQQCRPMQRWIAVLIHPMQCCMCEISEV